MIEYMLAAALLFAPDADRAAVLFHVEGVADAARHILTVRQCHNAGCLYTYDASTLRLTVAEMADCPDLSWLDRYPPLEVLDRCWSMNRRYSESLENRLALTRVGEDAVISARLLNDYYGVLWNYLRTARSADDVYFRRIALRNYVAAVGWARFSRGWLPPVWAEEE